MSVRKVKENKRRQRKVSVNFRKARVFRPGTQHRAGLYPPADAADYGDSQGEDEVFEPYHRYGWGDDS